MTSSPGGPALRPTPLYRATALLAVCALTVGAAGCGLRIGDAAPQALPTASEQEATRDALARHTVLLSSTAASMLAAFPDDPSAPVASALVADTAVQLEALGGVWEPYATAVPTTYPTASPVATAADGATQEALAEVLSQGVVQAREAALAATQADRASLYAAVAVSWSVRLAALSPGSVSPAARSTDLASPLPGDLLRAYDATRYALEEVAARSEGDTRALAHAQSQAADDLVNASLAAGGEDTRLAAYEEPAAEGDAGPDLTWARHVWLQVAGAEVTAVGTATGQARAEYLDAAVYAALTATDWGAEISALPGH